MKKRIKLDKKDYIIFFLVYSLIILFSGSVFNYLAITNNGCKMPVLTPHHYVSERHFSYQDSSEINYPYLSDIIHIGNSVYSIGDFTMIISFILFTIVLFIYGIHVLKNQVEVKNENNRKVQFNRK